MPGGDRSPGSRWERLDADVSLTRSNGQVKIWNYETQTDLKTFEVTDVPVRCVRYIARKNWVRFLSGFAST
jgi:hypothetical protein